MAVERTDRQVRSIQVPMQTRAAGSDGDMKIEGYFAVFDDETLLYDSEYYREYEKIDRHAFDNTLKSEDVRALINHEDASVLGRTKAGTLTLRTDDKGLWGSIDVNPNDTEAVNLYERVKRGDVDQCSFGFSILDEDHTTENREGEPTETHYTIKRVKLYEVSVCTFPAYENTGVEARSKKASETRRETLETRKQRLKERLKNGIKTTDFE